MEKITFKEGDDPLEYSLRCFNAGIPVFDIKIELVNKDVNEIEIDKIIKVLQNRILNNIDMISTHKNWECLKCKNKHFSTDAFRATGSGFSRIFDVQNKKFTTVTCSKCNFTEIYKSSASDLGNLFDFFVG